MDYKLVISEHADGLHCYFKSVNILLENELTNILVEEYTFNRR